MTGKALFWGLPALQFIPWQAYAWEQLSMGVFPLWNDLNGMGAPFLANYQLALFYPPTWILYGFAALGGIPWLAWGNTLLVYVHLVWAGIGMIRLVRQMGGKALAQTLAALSFSMSGYFVARLGFFSIIWAGAWMPWVVLCASRIASPLRGKEAATGAGFIPLPLAGCVAMMLLAGHAQLSWYILLYVAAWVGFGAMSHYGAREALVSLVRLGLAYFVAVVLSAVQLLPTLEYLLLSQRNAAVDYETAMAYSFWPWKMITFLAPDFFGNPGMGNYWGYASYHEDGIYIGLLPFLLAAGTFLALFSRRKREKVKESMPLIRFLWALIVIGMLLGMGKFTPVFPFLFANVPTFDMFHGPVRIMVWMVFSQALLAAVAVERLWERPSSRTLYWTRLATAGAVAVTLGAFGGWYFLQEISPTFIRATAISGIWGVGFGILTLTKPDSEDLPARTSWWRIMVGLWVGLDLITAGWWLNPGIAMDYFAPPAGESVLADLAGEGRVYQSLADNYRLKFKRFVRIKDYQSLEPMSTMRLLALPNVNMLEQISFVNNFDPFAPERYTIWMENLEGLPNDELFRWLSVMNVTVNERVDPQQPLGVEYLSLVAEGRFSWRECALIVETGEDAWRAVRNVLAQPVAEAERYVVIEGSPPYGEKCASMDKGEISIMRTRPDQVTLSVTSRGGGWLVMRDVWYPGWRVFVDGRPAEHYQADYLFRAAAVPAGTHTVKFVYSPLSFYAGLCVSLSGFLVISTIIMIKRRNRVLEQGVAKK